LSSPLRSQKANKTLVLGVMHGVWPCVTHMRLRAVVALCTVRMEWAPSRRVDVASKGQLGELKCEVGLPL